MTSKLSRLALAAAVACSAWTAPAAAQNDYPARPLRILVPFPAGGAIDTIARTLGERLSTQLGQPLVIDNRPGAGGRIAAGIVATADPDGYTLLLSTPGPISISPALFKALPYDPERDFAAVTRVAEIINVMVVNPAPGAKTVKEFVDWAKKRTADVRFGSSGAGQPDHLAGEFFQRLAGLRMTHVPYKGGGPALVDLVSGDLQVMFSTYVVAAPHVSTGRLRILAVTTPQRQPLLPDLPAVGESVPGFAVSNWTGVFVSSKTPRRITDRLFAEFNKAVLYPDVKTRQNAAGIDPIGSASIAEFQTFVREDARRWAGIIRDANIKVE